MGGSVGKRAVGGVGKAGSVAEAIDRGGGESVSGVSCGQSVSGVGYGSGVGGSDGARGGGNDDTSLSLGLGISRAAVSAPLATIYAIAGLNISLPLAVAATTALTTIAAVASVAGLGIGLGLPFAIAADGGGT